MQRTREEQNHEMDRMRCEMLFCVLSTLAPPPSPAMLSPSNPPPPLPVFIMAPLAPFSQAWRTLVSLSLPFGFS